MARRSDEEGADGGMQVITRAAAILGALAEPERRSQPGPAGGADRPAQDHGAPHLRGARAGRLRAHRRRERPPRARRRPAASGGGRPPRPDRACSSRRWSASRWTSTRPWTWPCWTAARSSSWPSTRRRSGRSWPSPASARTSPPTRWPAARPCWRSCRARRSCGACRAGSSPRSAGARARARRSCASSRRCAPPASRYEREEMRHGICAVAVAVTDVDGRSASIAVPMPAARFAESEERVAAELARAAGPDRGQTERSLRRP